MREAALHNPPRKTDIVGNRCRFCGSSEQKAEAKGEKCVLFANTLGELCPMYVFARSVRASGGSERYDVVICSNVLSAIPCRRTQKQLIKRALRSLNPGGTLLVTTQFKNSHYSSWKTSPNAKPYMDGFIVESRQRPLFLRSDRRSGSESWLCLSSGFDVVDSGHVRELAYVLAVRG